MLRSTAFRRFLSSAVVAPVLLLAACEGMTPGGYSGDVDQYLARGRAYVAEITSRPAAMLTDADVLALGYLERARLGLGSPFRLVEFALHDPDLPGEVQTTLAYAILARALDGGTYHIDPRVLETARLAGAPPEASTGRRQLALIERTIESAPSAAAGERAVRLGYMLSAAERTVDPRTRSVIAHVAAMVADRRRAREDATLLLRTAARTGQDPLVLLRTWRRELRLSVERPAFAGMTLRDEEAEAREGPVVAIALRSLARRLTAPTSLVDGGGAATTDVHGSLLSPASAERLRELAARRDYPAQAPIAVAVEINRDGLLRQRLGRDERAARERFVGETWNEERLAAGAALASAVASDSGARMELVVLQAATFMRAWNQEEPWFPGDLGPGARDLEARFGIVDVRFDAQVPDSWRPYFMRMLARSLTDLQRVLPTFSVRGLEVVIGDLPGGALALALHEPAGRTLYLPPLTGSGTLAHELAHDLDWQLARRRYGTRGGYATDMAVRTNRRDRIAAAMMELSSSLTQPAPASESSPHSTRPAEVFARGTDWLVATTLARDGRLGGYLTSFQDPVLTGYGTTRGPDISGAAVPALLSILDGIAPVADSTRGWVLESHGPSRSLTATELARAVTEAGASLPPERRIEEIREVGQRSVQAVGYCGIGSAAGVRRLATAQRALAEFSAAAAARGAAIDAIRELAARTGGIEVLNAVDEWIGWRIFGAPEPAEQLAHIGDLVPAFEDLLRQADTIHEGRRAPAGPNAFSPRKEPALCGGNPFAANSATGRFRTPDDGAA